MIEIAVLDLAGTTICDNGLVMAAFASALQSVGCDTNQPEGQAALEYASQTMGSSKISVFTAIFEHDVQRANQANSAFEQAYAARLELAQPIAGAAQTIELLRQRGIKVALTTGFSPQTRQALLAAVGWQSLADLCLSPADAGRGRPLPDLALTALLRLGGNSVNGLLVAGDTAADMQCGRNAGAGAVVGVLTGAHNAAQLVSAGASHIVDSIAELPELVASL
ncbi:MAG: HAD hydrolase-like protein [Bifidobacteriaceae bacterium]|nr:HAD hydrolase-like protein [Bifidobacteriaceae bacterium]